MSDLVLLPIGIVFALILVAFSTAGARGRERTGWAALSAVAATAATFGAWSGLLTSLESGSSEVAAVFALLVGPYIAQLFVLLVLLRLPPGQPYIGFELSVLVMDIGGEEGLAWIDTDGLRLVTNRGERLLPRTDLARIEADGEYLILQMRSGGEELRLRIIAFDDSCSCRRTSTALATALRVPVARARLRSG